MMAEAVPIAALSRLNVHARAHGCGFRAIYEYKSLAAIAAALEGVSQLRFVQWTGKCNRCENGRFRYWDWPEGETVRCRGCNGTGRVTLRFTESHFADGTRWHHPWTGRWTRPGHTIAYAVLGIAWDQSPKGEGYVTAAGQRVLWYDLVDTWAPNTPGEKLPVAELVPLLNEVEDWIESLDLAGHSGNREADYRTRRAREHLYTAPPNTGWWDEDMEPQPGYRLDIGRQPGGCFVCGSDDLATYCYGAGNRQLGWSLPICKHHSADGPEKALHPKNPEPPTALITPDIRRWLDRHKQIWDRG